MPNLPEYKTFEEWNAHKEVADAARSLYHDIDKLELYPGLHAEGNNNDGLGKKYGPLRVSTMRIGLLFDAIALVRSHFPFILTMSPMTGTDSWGPFLYDCIHSYVNGLCTSDWH